MNDKYKHLRLKKHKSEFKYVLLRERSDLNGLMNGSDEFPIAIFISAGEVSAIVPDNLTCAAEKTESGWTCLQIVGEMPFGSVQGLISEISGGLAQSGLGVCVVSTYLTDWFFIRSKNLRAAVVALESIGWVVDQT